MISIEQVQCDSNLLNDFVSENFGLVHYTVQNKFNKKPQVDSDYEDVFQIGCIGLLKAIRSFDPEKGYTFSTFASKVIWNIIMCEYVRPNNRKRNYIYKFVSLDEPVPNTEGLIYADCVMNTKIDIDKRIILEDLLQYYLKKVRKPSQRHIIRLYLKGYTQADIGRIIGASRQNVCLVIKKFAKSK